MMIIILFQGFCYMRPSETTVTVAESNHNSHAHKPLLRASSPAKVNGRYIDTGVSTCKSTL